MNPEGFASYIIDICADSEIVKDYEINIHENVVLKCRIDLEKGFIEIYRNFETEKIAYAWIFERERIFGADNTGEWHTHPFKNPDKHKKSEPISLSTFLKKIEKILDENEI